MRIDGTGPVGGSKKTEKKGRKESEGEGFSSLLSAGETTETASSSAPVNVQITAPLDALLAAQQIDGGIAESAEETLEYGDELLDSLQNLQHNLLGGDIDPQEAHRILQRLDAHSKQVQDPHLLGIIKDIEVRAAVEAAKLEKLQK